MQRPSHASSGLQNPRTIEEWLLGLQLIQYADVFIVNGWDNVDFLGDLTIKDLIYLNIQQSEHQDAILRSIEQLKKR